MLNITIGKLVKKFKDILHVTSLKISNNNFLTLFDNKKKEKLIHVFREQFFQHILL